MPASTSDHDILKEAEIETKKASMASSDTCRIGASHLQPIDARKEESKTSWPLRHTIFGGIPKPVLEYSTNNDMRAPFKWVKNWKRKRKQKARVPQPTNGKRKLVRFVPSWMHTAKRKKGDHSGFKPMVTKLGKEPPAQPKEKPVNKPGKGGIIKEYFKSLVSLPKSRDNSRVGLSSNSESSFTHTFSIADAESSASHDGFRSSRSDFDPESASCCQRSPFADNNRPNDEYEMNPPRLGRWGYWNDLVEPIEDIQPKEEAYMSVDFDGRAKVCANGRFLKLQKLCWPIHWSRQRRMRSKTISGPVCDAAKQGEALQQERRSKERPNKDLQGSMPCNTEEATKDSFGCSGHRMLSRSCEGKLSGRNHLSDEGSNGSPQVFSKCCTTELSDTKRIASKYMSQAALEKLFSTSSNVSITQEISACGISEGNNGSTVQTHPKGCNKCCTEASDSNKSVSKSRNQPALKGTLEEFFSRLMTRSDVSVTQGTSACGISVASDCTNNTRTGLQQVPSILIARSGNAPQAASSRYGGDLASLNAKMESRFEQVLKAIDIVADQVKKSAESRWQTELMADDDEENDQSSLIKSCSSELGTIEMELSPLRNCVTQSQLLEIPVIKEFKGAVDDARFKMRVLAGLLTVEKDAKMASTRDFQSKEMILTMGIIVAQMLEGETLLEKPWHIKYVLDYCISSIFFNGPHGSPNCICSRPRPARINFPSGRYDFFCNDIELSSMTFDSLCDDATRAVEELVGSRAKDWSEALTNMFWNCAVCCFHVHKLIKAIHQGKGRMRILHPDRSTRFAAPAMDPLDTGDFKAFHKKVHFTIFSGFMLEGTVLCRSQVYLEPNFPGIRL
ncbi:hypothetical protein GOP47_0003968 [Adiantum capillus-veneris]|uniref:Uncharacterized protein n=1 Tax=Adiantum capillus-veneris TaxID=13818 RepID=A0A9D4ZPX8_ADICA|nr:hypothetical protein GOP47_0003968 [Adiantum capillus-veneris]